MRGTDERQERLARTVLAAAMLVSAASVIYLGRNFTFWIDELYWLTFDGNLSPNSLLTPHFDHLIAIPRVVYHVLPGLFGTSYLPFRILDLVAVLTVGALVFGLIRRRLGPLAAIGPAVVLLFFGSAYDIVLSPLGIPFAFSIAFGLAALSAVENDTRRWDRAACVLLTLSILSHTFGAITAGGIAVYLLLDRERRGRVWVSAVPLALWLVWWLWARKFDQHATDAANIAGAPWFVLQSIGVSIQSLFGLGARFGGGSSLYTAIATPAAGVLGAGWIVAVGLRLSRGAAGRWTIPYLAIAFTFWFGLALEASDFRQPTTPRYLYFGLIMVLLTLAEAWRGTRLSRGATAVILAVFALGLAGNVVRMVTESRDIEADARDINAQLAVVSLSTGGTDPNLPINLLGRPASQRILISPLSIAAFNARRETLGMPLDEIPAQTDEVREGADYVLARLDGLAPVSADGLDLPAERSCTEVDPDSTGRAQLTLQPGFTSLTVPADAQESAALEVGRFADDPTVPIGKLGPGEEAVLGIPADASPQPWSASVDGPVRICTFG